MVLGMAIGMTIVKPMHYSMVLFHYASSDELSNSYPMTGIKQKILRIVLATALILAPMAPAVAVTAMNYSSAHTLNADIVDHGSMHHSVDVQQDTEHCTGNNEVPGQGQCQHSCCGYSSLSLAFVVPQSVLFHYINSTPPFVNALQTSLTAFTHFRPPA
jgi:hypothetical protein